MAIYKGTTKIAGVGSTRRNIGEIVPSTLPIVDAGLHLLDGALISGSGTYSAFVTYVAGLVSSYPNLFVTEASWQTAVSAYGVCGKFVYDSVNNTVRLPKITGIIEGTTDTTALGDLVEAGLPNITGTAASVGISTDPSAARYTGAFGFKTGASAAKTIASLNTNSYSDFADFDASRSSSIYGNSSTVQPQTIKTLYYICIATSVKTAIEADIDDIATDLNLKAGTDLANLTNQGSIVAAKASMPSTVYENLTFGATGTQYTAPSSGYFVFYRASDGSNTSLTLWNTTTGLRSETCGTIGVLSVFVPASKGDKVNMYWLNGASSNSIYFVYAEGSKSEYSNS